MPTSAERIPYLDASALVKLVVIEPETAALRRFVDDKPMLASCALARVEVARAVRPHGLHAVETAHALLEQLELAQLDDELLDLAATLDPPIRSLDAIHIAAAMELGDELDALVTYDVQMTRAATALGLPVIGPG